MKKFTICITSFILVFALGVGTFAESVGTREDRLQANRQSHASRRVFLQAEKKPCGNARGLQLSQCIMELRRSGSPIANTSIARPLTRRRGIDRRSATLHERAKRVRSVLSPREPGMFEVIKGAPDQDDATYHGSALHTLVPKEAATQKNTVQSRAAPGLRQSASQTGNGVSPLLCARRDGIRLLACLQEFNIRISPSTVDKETWGIWEQMQKKAM